jgi:glucosamine-6-phosphate deaminase
MRVINAKDADEAVKLAAETFIEAADARPDAPIGLATGGTMDGIYLKLKELGFRPKTKHAFALDEYEGSGARKPELLRSRTERQVCREAGMDWNTPCSWLRALLRRNGFGTV